MPAMGNRLKFYGWGYENTGLSDAERDRLFRFVADRLKVEPRRSPPPRVSEVALRAPRITPPPMLVDVLTDDPYERLLHTMANPTRKPCAPLRATSRTPRISSPCLPTRPKWRPCSTGRAAPGSPSFRSAAVPRS